MLATFHSLDTVLLWCGSQKKLLEQKKEEGHKQVKDDGLCEFPCWYTNEWNNSEYQVKKIEREIAEEHNGQF